ncbi:MAG: hypothetical protein LBK56_15505 [Gracilibacteraceae bacterium]|jgi:thioredoxin reductase (NADPH)|nr:hypothetical protein [Gracilibacteraceae bacterium]
METNIEGVYAAGDNRVKYLRQIATCVGDGATAAVAAERYISELDDFERDVLQAGDKVILYFFNAYQSETIAYGTLLEEANQMSGYPQRVVKVDTATRKVLAQKYGVTAVPAALLLEKGERAGELKAADKSALAREIAAFAAGE